MEERKKILNMLKSGKINEEEADRLLASLVSDTANNFSVRQASSTFSDTNIKNLKGKLCIEIQSKDEDQVFVKIPLKLAPMGLRMMPAKTYERIKNEHGIDLDQILNNINELAGELDEDLVNVKSASGDSVRIYIKK